MNLTDYHWVHGEPNSLQHNLEDPGPIVDHSLYCTLCHRIWEYRRNDWHLLGYFDNTTKRTHPLPPR